MRNCNEFCNNQTYLTAMYCGIGTQLKPSHPTYLTTMFPEIYSGKVGNINHIIERKPISSYHIRRLNWRT